MQLGVMVEGQEGLTWTRWRRLAAAVEALGFESLWRSDHLMSLRDPARDALDTWTSLAVAAAETRRITLGPLVCPLTFYHPAMLAKAAASVDALSGGRLVLGLGAGWNDLEHRAFGLPFPPLGERLDRLAEGVAVIRRLLDDGIADFAGRHYRLEGARAFPKAVQRPLPLLIAGGGERRVLPLVARLADEWNLTTGDPAVFRAKSERLDACCHEIGRDPRAIRRSAATGFLIWRDDAERRARCAAVRRWDRDLAAVDVADVPAVAAAMGWPVGRPAELAERLRALGAAGAERVMLELSDQDDLDALELVAREVLPAVAD